MNYMNYYYYPYNQYYINPIQRHHSYQPTQYIQPLFYHNQCLQPLQPYCNRRACMISAAQQPYTVSSYNLSPQQNMSFQELLEDMTIAAMKQSKNKTERVIADAIDLVKSNNPIEYITKSHGFIE